MSSDSATMVAPESVAELADVLRGTEADGATVSVRGGGTKQTWGGAGGDAQVVIGTGRLTRVVEHAAGDLVLTVEAGARLHDVQALLADHGQRVALDPPEAGATIGGIVSTAASGPLRFRYGTPRDQLIGMTVVLADGTIAKSGGKVVKNVAGYDLGKVLTGSFGTLGVIATVTLKLQPVAAARRVVSVPADDPGAVWAALARSTAAPSAVEWDGSAVHVLIEASSTAVDAIAAAAAATVGTTTVADEVPSGFGARPWGSGEVGVKVTHRLSSLDAVVAAVRAHMPGARLTAHVGSGVVWAGWPSTDPAAVKAAVDSLRVVVASYDGQVVVLDAPTEVKSVIDVWGPVAARSLMHRLKDQFDPGHRLNPGRFVDGI
ncbi:MAG TPA: FAD-binding oxidoreductase [Mycobacteriales bacterium]|nr:FAD-binding oxidoreductase [Mycobacteriales bacterium]